MSSSNPWIESSGEAAEPAPSAPLGPKLRVSGGPEGPPAEERHAEPRRVEAAEVRVVVRLSDGDQVEAGTFASVDEAKAYARELTRRLDEGAEWPYVGARFLRPAAVVSVDVLGSGPPKWIGSADRATSWANRGGK